MAYIFTGYLVKPHGTQPPYFSKTPYIKGVSSNYIFPFKIKVIGKNENIDTGSFMLYSVPCRISSHKKSTEISSDILKLEIDIKHLAQGWCYTTRPVIKIRGQIFIHQNGCWTDVLDIPEIALLKSKWEQNIAEQSTKWSSLYNTLLQLGVDKKEARSFLENGGNNYAENFIKTYEELKRAHPPRKIIKRVCEKAYCQSYIRDALGKWLTCDGSFDATIAALKHYIAQK